MIGRATGGKPINLSQLQTELEAGGLDCSRGLGMAGEVVHTFDAEGAIVDFATPDQATLDQAIANHVALRDKTDAEYSAEFQATGTTAARKQEIRDIIAGLLPREQMPITQEEWDVRMAAV